jgi:ubiquinone/menaquinone biosynthesis C-methylase UbiE
MVTEPENAGDTLAFWNQRARLGAWAGTRDVIAKQLEIEALTGLVRDGMRILEVGCGNGITALEIARQRDVRILAIDFAEEMIASAKELMDRQELKGSVEFAPGDVRKMAGLPERFDLIYSERVLINLPDWPTQRQALEDISRLLAPGGIYAMCENSQDGLDTINGLRARVGLRPIAPPWHNRYLRDAELAQVVLRGVRLEAVRHYSSTYYFLSRVVNAAIAAREGREPEYESPINQLALQLPPIGEFGQGRLWIWRRDALALCGE